MSHQCCEPCGSSMPASPTQPSAALQYTGCQSQAPPADSRTESAAVPPVGGGEAKAAAGAAMTPQEAGAVAGSPVAPANEAATGGCLTFAPPAAAASMLSPGVDAAARDGQHIVVRHLTTNSPCLFTLCRVFCSGAAFAGGGRTFVTIPCNDLMCAMRIPDGCPSRAANHTH